MIALRLHVHVDFTHRLWLLMSLVFVVTCKNILKINSNSYIYK